jgi:hypothetical protein
MPPWNLETGRQFRLAAMQNPIKNRQRILRLIKPYHRIMPLFLPVRNLAVCWCLIIASPALTFAESTLTPQGPEYAIAGLLSGDQVKPQAAVTPAGGYLVWQDNSVASLGLRIRAGRLGSDFKIAGAPFLVSSALKSKTTGDQENPQVALLPDNSGAVIVWQGSAAVKAGKVTVPGIRQIYARIIDATGAPAKSDIRVGSHPKNNQINPVVAVAADGTILIVWASFGQDGSRQGVFGQLFSATGTKAGAEFQINQFTANNQRSPAVAALTGNNFAIAWISESERSSSGVDVYARLYASSGVPVTGELLINSSPTNVCANPTVAGGSQGGFAVAWSQNDNATLTAGSLNGVQVSGVQTGRSTNSWDIFAGLFDANGTAAGPSFRLNSYSYGDQYAPKISALGSNYLSVWMSLGQDGSWEGVFGQEFADGGGLLGEEFRVNTSTVSHQIQPAVVSDGSSSFLAVWSSFGVGTTFNFDLFARKYLP